MPGHCLPSFYLSIVIGAPSTHIVPAVPLEPPSRVIGMNPPLFPPVGQRFRGIDAEEIQFGDMTFMTESRIDKPILRELACAVSHIFPTENTKFKHLLWGQFGPEVWMEVFPHRFRQEVDVIRLHRVIDAYAYLLYLGLP